MKDDNLVGAQGKLRVCSSFIIAKLNFISIRCKNFNYGPDFTSLKLALRQIFKQGDCIKQLYLSFFHFRFLFRI